MKFLQVGMRSLNLGICPKLSALHIEAPCMVGLELKGCGVLSEASINCPLLTSLDASFCRWCRKLTFDVYHCGKLYLTSHKICICSQLTDDCLSATTVSCPLIEKLILMSCPSIGSDGLSSLRWLKNLTYLDLSYTFLMDLQPVFSSCLRLTVNFSNINYELLQFVIFICRVADIWIWLSSFSLLLARSLCAGVFLHAHENYCWLFCRKPHPLAPGSWRFPDWMSQLFQSSPWKERKKNFKYLDANWSLNLMQVFLTPTHIFTLSLLLFPITLHSPFLTIFLKTEVVLKI